MGQINLHFFPEWEKYLVFNIQNSRWARSTFRGKPLFRNTTYFSKIQFLFIPWTKSLISFPCSPKFNVLKMPYRNKVIQLYLTLFKKGTLSEKFFCEFCKIFKTIFFTEYLWTTTSEYLYRQWALKIWYEYSPETSLLILMKRMQRHIQGPVKHIWQNVFRKQFRKTFHHPCLRGSV